MARTIEMKDTTLVTHDIESWQLSLLLFNTDVEDELPLQQIGMYETELGRVSMIVDLLLYHLEQAQILTNIKQKWED